MPKWNLGGAAGVGGIVSTTTSGPGTTTSSPTSSGASTTTGATGSSSATTTGPGSSTGGANGSGGRGTGGLGGGGTGGAGGRGGSAGAGGRNAGGSGGAPVDAGRDTGRAGGVDAGRDASAGGSTGSGGAAGAGDAGNLVNDLLRITQGCARILSSHTYALDNGQMVNICGLTGAAYFTADMDIDCDGRDVGDGKCPGPDPSYQPDTAFHNNANQPLAASVTPYVVIPQDFQTAGLAGGNVVAVIYQGKLQFAVFGDTGPTDIIGEASYSCAAALGINPNPANGGVGSGVTYIAFTGAGAKPSNIEDQAATATLGQQLAQKLIQDNP